MRTLAIPFVTESEPEYVQWRCGVPQSQAFKRKNKKQYSDAYFTNYKTVEIYAERESTDTKMHQRGNKNNERIEQRFN